MGGGVVGLFLETTFQDLVHELRLGSDDVLAVNDLSDDGTFGRGCGSMTTVTFGSGLFVNLFYLSRAQHRESRFFSRGFVRHLWSVRHFA